MKKKRLVCGVGVNDSYYEVSKKVNGKIVWVCPFYRAWVNMLQRCYSDKYQLRQPTYKDVTVCKEWLSFMAFRGWMIMQQWEGNALDKDLKIIGNKVYRPDACMFITQNVNKFTLDCGSSRGDYPIGVHKYQGKYMSRVADLTGKQIFLGCFDTPELAHEAWRNKKLELAYDLQDQQDRLEVKQGIQNYIDRILMTDYYLHQWYESNGKTRQSTHQTVQ